MAKDKSRVVNAEVVEPGDENYLVIVEGNGVVYDGVDGGIAEACFNQQCEDDLTAYLFCDGLLEATNDGDWEGPDDGEEEEDEGEEREAA